MTQPSSNRPPLGASSPETGRPPLNAQVKTSGPASPKPPATGGLWARLKNLARELGAARADRKKAESQDSRSEILSGWATGRRSSLSGFVRLPAFIRRRMPDVPDHLQEQYQTTIGFLQIGFVVLAATFLVAVMGTVILNASIFDPRSGKGVMEALKNPEDLDFSIETARQRRLDGTILETQQSMGVRMNIPERKFLISAWGYEESPFRTAYDGKIWLYRPEDGTTVRLKGKPSNQVFRPVVAKDLEKYAGDIITDKATVAGERGWVVKLKPSGELYTRLMGANILNLSGADIDLLRAGKFRTVFARASAIRSSRRLYTINYQVRLDSGAVISGLVTYRKQNTGALDSYDISSQVRDDS